MELEQAGVVRQFHAGERSARLDAVARHQHVEGRAVHVGAAAAHDLHRAVERGPPVHVELPVAAVAVDLGLEHAVAHERVVFVELERPLVDLDALHPVEHRQGERARPVLHCADAGQSAVEAACVENQSQAAESIEDRPAYDGCSLKHQPVVQSMATGSSNCDLEDQNHEDN